MQLQPAKNAINNYKGVMLCSRPNENKQAEIQRPFCARVVPPDPLGLGPFKNNTEIKYVKKTNPILGKHKQWLQQLKNKQQQKKELEQIKKASEELRFEKIRAQAEADRQKAKKMKQQYNNVTKNVLNILDDNGQNKKAELNADNLRKLNELAMEDQTKQKQFKKKKNQEKPLWAYSQKEIEKKENEQVDNLLDFFENTDVEKFIEDTQVNAILKNLKEKIENIKKQENWKEKQIAKEREAKKIEQNTQEEVDKQTHVSGKSQGGKSVASEKTTKKIQELQQKLEKKKEGVEQWDRYTKNSKNSYANIQERIAKNVADEVLRSYGNFKGVHSNNSIRRLLEKEAAKQLTDTHPRPIITTVFKEKTPLNMNTLPYLHRNPAI